MSGYTNPPDTRASGATGHIGDHNNIADDLITLESHVADGLTGATAAYRMAGGTASGAPVSGTFLLGDTVVDQTGKLWVCTVAGTPGTWTQIGGAGFTSPLTTLGDLMYENASPAAARLAGNTTGTKNFLTQTGTGSVSAAPAWGAIQAADVPTLNQDTTGTAAAGTNSWNSIYLAPSGCISETFSRYLVINASGQLVTQTLYMTAIPMLKNQVVTTLNVGIASTANATGITNSWLLFADSGAVCRAVSATNTTNVTLGTVWSQNVASPYTVPSSGLYYIGVMFQATQTPALLTVGPATLTALSFTPVLAGASNTGCTTPITAGTSLTAVGVNNHAPFWAYVS